MHKSSRAFITALPIVAGAVFLSSPAHADSPWNVSDHSTQVMPTAPATWNVPDHSSQGIPNPVTQNPIRRTAEQNHITVSSAPHKHRVRSVGHTSTSIITHHRSHVWNVKSGNTLSVIARIYGKSINDIASFNGIEDPDLIFVGQTIIIP